MYGIKSAETETTDIIYDLNIATVIWCSNFEYKLFEYVRHLAQKNLFQSTKVKINVNVNIDVP